MNVTYHALLIAVIHSNSYQSKDIEDILRLAGPKSNIVRPVDLPSAFKKLTARALHFPFPFLLYIRYLIHTGLSSFDLSQSLKNSADQLFHL